MTSDLLINLGNGLILRRATIEDTDELAAFNSVVHKDPEREEPNEFVLTWVRDLMTGKHPTLGPQDFTVVVDTNVGKIVSSMNLIPQTWSYEGIEFGVGRPELVGTDPEYRRRGLVREQFKVIHQWSMDRGHKMQAITGIPFYYRQFGYEMCMNLGGSRIGYRPHVPRLKDGEQENFVFRSATPEDILFISKVYNHGIKRSLIACVRDPIIWQYDIFGKSETASASWKIIENLAGEPLGFFLHAKELHGPNIQLWGYELKPGASYLDITPILIRYLEKTGLELAEKKDEIDFAGYNFNLGGEHPAYDMLPERMPRVGKPYAWYIRVPNLADFLMHIRPVLEKRLADSPAVGYTGELKLSFYRSGVKFHFDKGKINAVEDYLPEGPIDGDATFPELTFLQVLVGYRTFAELSDSLPDCFPESDRGRALVNILFPKKSSNVWAVN